MELLEWASQLSAPSSSHLSTLTLTLLLVSHYDPCHVDHDQHDQYEHYDNHAHHHHAEDSVEKEVVLAVNGQESRIVFIDHEHGEMEVSENDEDEDISDHDHVTGGEYDPDLLSACHDGGHGGG